MPARSLPARPNLEQLKIQANELHRAHRYRDLSAAARIAAQHPAMKGLSPQAVLDKPLALADAQLVIAREYGFDNWAQLKRRVTLASRIDEITPHPRFADALAALDAGDVPRLQALLAADPSLVHARTNLAPPYGYFTGATLLHHVAGNPGRNNPLPANIVEIARVLLDAGADVNALTVGPSPSISPESRGADTIGLVVTSKQASDMAVSGPLMDVLLERGARLNLTSDDALDASLANHAPRAAEKMIALGAKPDLLAAAALGRMDLLRGFFDRSGKLLSRPRRQGQELTDRDAIGLANLYAYVRHQPEAVDFLLEKDGNWNMTGVNNGTALHRAAWAGDLAMVERLVARGADVNNRDNPFGATPMGWASYNRQPHVVEWLQQHAAIDLHDAVFFDLRDQLRERLRDGRASANTRLDDGEIPQGTPLHAAARLNREPAARILLEFGADPNILAGNGLTPLDIADLHGATDVAALLEQHGGTRTTEATRTSTHPRLKPFEKVSKDVLDAYQSGDAAALQRVQEFINRAVTLSELRKGVQTRLHKGSEADISLAEARDVVAGLRGFASWAALADSVTRPDDRSEGWARPLFHVDERRNTIDLRRPPDDTEWDTVIAVMAERKLAGLDANGHMTDAALARIARLDHVTTLQLGGSNALTDAGLQHLAGMPQLQALDLSGWEMPFTDRGLEALRHLTALRKFQMCWPQRVTDAGVANLRFCDHLERVDLMGTPTGDGAIDALAGKSVLRHFKSGKRVTDAGLPLIRRFPAFTSWNGGRIDCSLMSFDTETNFLLLDGPFSERGLASLGGLDGLVGLNLFWHVAGLGADALKALVDLPNLQLLGCHGGLCTDEAMPHIAALPRLRMLMAQGTVATDAGFAALSRSRSIEYIWGRECPNLGSRGFAALSAMPALRGLAVSCKNVDDRALATLPRFPALRQLLPMDVSDEGFRHVGQCAELEHLWCMYCRDTTDVATEHLAGLSKLTAYYAGQTKITDRSLAILARMPSLEQIELWNCAGITNCGVGFLAALPRLREITIDGCRQVTAEVTTMLPAQVRVRHSG